MKFEVNFERSFDRTVVSLLYLCTGGVAAAVDWTYADRALTVAERQVAAFSCERIL